MKVTIDITAKELNQLEDYITCHLLCSKHKSLSVKSLPTNRWTDTMSYGLTHGQCEACTKLTREHKNIAIGIWNRLADAYLKEEKK